MPRGPKGEKRPADVIGNAVKVMRIATGEEVEILDADDGKDPAAKALGRRAARREPRASRRSGERRSQKRQRNSVGENRLVDTVCL